MNGAVMILHKLLNLVFFMYLCAWIEHFLLD